MPRTVTKKSQASEEKAVDANKNNILDNFDVDTFDFDNLKNLNNMTPELFEKLFQLCHSRFLEITEQMTTYEKKRAHIIEVMKKLQAEFKKAHKNSDEDDDEDDENNNTKSSSNKDDSDEELDSEEEVDSDEESDEDTKKGGKKTVSKEVASKPAAGKKSVATKESTPAKKAAATK